MGNLVAQQRRQLNVRRLLVGKTQELFHPTFQPFRLQPFLLLLTRGRNPLAAFYAGQIKPTPIAIQF
jgi:hypothetical protein